jgi:regulator of protease activity HflC (stomatin/prohibitin superfamily)
MFGLKFVKFEPNYYIHVIKKGRVVKEGQGLSFWFYMPTTSIIKIPLETKNVPFVFEETSNDYQTLTIQGDLIFKISDTKKIIDQVNFTIGFRNFDYLSDDPEKLNQIIINIVKTIAKTEISNLSLRDSIKSIDRITKTLKEAVQNNEYLQNLGIKITNINILSISPNKETARALEAETRENILREADDAVYKRRNSAVEQERKIKENELNTEVAVEEKKRQIMETQIEGQRSIKEKERIILQEELSFKIKQEQENTKLIDISKKNKKNEADIKAYSLNAILEPLSKMNPDIIRSLSSIGMDSEQLIANAFTGLAENAEKIGELNISPELLQKLLKK